MLIVNFVVSLFKAHLASGLLFFFSKSLFLFFVQLLISLFKTVALSSLVL
jgi:hypothetical protein